MYKFLIGAFLVCGWSTVTAELSSIETADSQNTTCNDDRDCPKIDEECKEICGCDKNIPTSFDNKTQDCVINVQLLILSLTEKYNTEGNNDMATEDDNGMARRIQAEADKIFQGIIVAAFLFIACASICTLTACIYCCRINYTDYQLKKSIKVLAKKMGQKKMKKPAKVLTEPMAESCNVIVEDAGVFCV